MGGLSVSIIVACHNEAATIRRKLDNCLALASADPVEILIVDDHSTDETVVIVSEYLGTHQPLPVGRTVRLLTNRHASGKNGALSTAFEEAQGSLYLVTDADIALGEDVLARARAYFEADARIGALCLSPCIASGNPAIEARYADGYEAFNRRLKMLQSRLDSLPILHGQAMFLRASLNIAPHNELPADDVDFAFQVRLQNSRARYVADLPFYEEIAREDGRVFWQKVRRAKAVMRSFWQYRRVLFNPRYGLFGLVCFPLDFALYFILAPMVLVASLMAAAELVVWHGVLGGGIVLTGLLVLLLAPPLRRVALYLIILLVSQGSLLLERRPRIRWNPQRGHEG